MKKLFLGILALAIGAFSFVSCDKDDKVDDDSGVKVKDYLTLDEQEQLISNALVAATQAFEFSDFTTGVKNVVKGLVGDSVDWNLSYELMREDSVINARMDILGGEYDGEYDFSSLDSLYFAAYMSVKDTIIDEEMYRVAVLDSADYEAEGFVSIIETLDGHRLILGGKLDMDSISRINFNTLNLDSLIDTVFFHLPEMASFVVGVDSTVLFGGGYDYTTDFVANLCKVERMYGPDSVAGLYISGKDLQFKTMALLDATMFGTEVGYDDENNELSFGLGLAYEGMTVATLDFKGVLPLLGEDANYLDTRNLIMLALSLSDLSAEANLMNGQINISAELKSNFVTNVSPIAFTSAEQMPKLVETLNKNFSGSISFKGFSEPQAKIMFAYDENRRDTVGYQGEYGDNVYMQFVWSFTHSGLYVAIEGRDSNGETVMVSVDDYLDEVALKFMHYFMVEDGKDTDPVKLVFKSGDFAHKVIRLINKVRRVRYPYMTEPVRYID